MRRLDVICKAITSLDLDTKIPGSPPELSRAKLSELMDCIGYVIFPEYSNSPMQCAPNLDRRTVLQRTLAHMADILDSQLFSAFLFQGHTKCFEDYVGYGESSKKDGKKETCDINPAVDANICVETKVHHREIERKAQEITERFLTEKLPYVRWLLRSDASVLFDNDVGATSRSEVVLCYPGIFCMRYQRTAHALNQLGAPSNFTRLLTEMAHGATGIDIHPCTSIGHHFYIDHGTGIVIGATSIVGNYVSIYQGVTLGAKSFPVDPVTGAKVRGLPRHPIIEDNVTIYANAVVLGRIRIGNGSTIGGNCWVVRDLPPGSVIAQTSNRKLCDVEMLFHHDGSGI